ncbi:nucleoporin protein Ndc1-Nup [Chlamydoabsidia padenii]|nr:nucleoporin protein Ndc1-Nup [Chlamydoabsidia padenii]
MRLDPPSTQPIPLERKYRDVYFDHLKKQALKAALSMGLISYILTVLIQLRITSIKGFLWGFFQQSVVKVAVIFSGILIILGFIRATQTSVWRPKYLCAGTELMAAFRNPDYYFTTLCYGLAGVVMIELYFSTLLEESYTSTWFIYPPGHRAYAKELNMERLFITFYGLVLGIGYSLKGIFEERYILRIPPVQEPKLWAIKVTMSTLIHWSWKYAGMVFLGSYLVFITTNSIVYYMVAPFVGIFWSGLLASPVMGFRWYDLYLIIRMVMAGSFITCQWLVADRVFDVFFAITLDISRSSPQPNQCLLDGLQNKQERTVIRSMAYQELVKVATKEPARRRALFLDTNHSFTASAWKSITDECILLLDDLRLRLANEYTTTDKKPFDPFDNYQSSSEKKRQIQQQQSTTIRRVQLVENGDILARLDDTNGSRLDDRTPGLFLSDPSLLDQTSYTSSWDTSSCPQDDDKWAMLPRLLVKDGWNRIGQFRWIKNMSIITIDQKTRVLFSNSPDLTCAIQALGGLTASSLNEDPYGYVQYDIPKILDALVGTLVDVEHFINSPPESYHSLPRLLQDPGVWTEPNSVIRALNDSIYEIVLTFREYMDEVKFKVEKKYQARLREFM